MKTIDIELTAKQVKQLEPIFNAVFQIPDLQNYSIAQINFKDTATGTNKIDKNFIRVGVVDNDTGKKINELILSGVVNL